MFDFGFGEMMIIGAVGLVILGPERLPQVARTAGEWLGKAQRFVAQVKDDINRESEFAELKKLQDEAKNLASDFKSTVEKAARDVEKEAGEASQALQASAKEAESAFEALNDKAKDAATEASDTIVSSTEVVQPDAPTATTVTETTSASNDDIAKFYGWEDESNNDYVEPSYVWKEPKTFAKRYKSGPSVDELAREIERLRSELGLREAQMQNRNRRLAVRARNNRPRIYR